MDANMFMELEDFVGVTLNHAKKTVFYDEAINCRAIAFGAVSFFMNTSSLCPTFEDWKKIDNWWHEKWEGFREIANSKKVRYGCVL